MNATPQRWLHALVICVAITLLSVAALTGWVRVKEREAAARLERERVTATVERLRGDLDSVRRLP